MSNHRQNVDSEPAAPLAGRAEPRRLSFQPENIFQHGKKSHQWCVSRRPDKQPRSVRTGNLIDVFNPDPQLLVSFEEARAAVEEGRFDLLGFCLTNLPYVCLDLDKSFNDAGELKSWAKKIVDEYRGTYIERSPSRTGLHIWLKVDPREKPTDKKKDIVNFSDGKCEVFFSGYLTMTGDVYE